jgi:hypothetical protein
MIKRVPTITTAAAALCISATGALAERLTVGAVSFQPDPALSAPSAAVTALGSSPVVVASLAFPSGATSAANAIVALPDTWQATSATYRLYWYAASGGRDDVLWSVRTTCVDDGETLAATYGASAAVVSQRGAARDLNITSATVPATIAGTPRSGTLCAVQVRRLGSNVADTLQATAHLISVDIIEFLPLPGAKKGPHP